MSRVADIALLANAKSRVQMALRHTGRIQEECKQPESASPRIIRADTLAVEHHMDLLLRELAQGLGLPTNSELDQAKERTRT